MIKCKKCAITDTYCPPMVKDVSVNQFWAYSPSLKLETSVKTLKHDSKLTSYSCRKYEYDGEISLKT